MNELPGGVAAAVAGALLVASAALVEDEQVTALTAGRFFGHRGVALLTTERLLLVNGRPYNPDLLAMAVSASLRVTGWMVDSSATLVFEDDTRQAVIDEIPDRRSAQSFAAAVRKRMP